MPTTVEHLEIALAFGRRGRASEIELRLHGSTAVWARCPKAKALLARHLTSPRDIDLAALGRVRTTSRVFLRTYGLSMPSGGIVTPYADRDFYVWDQSGKKLRVEVFFDRLKFVHTIDLGNDFPSAFPTLRLDTLIMTKLQMRRPTFRDSVQLVGLLIQVGAEADKTARDFDDTLINWRASRDFRCWRDFNLTLTRLSDPETTAALALTSEEKAAFEKGRGIISRSLLKRGAGVGWFVSRGLAKLGVEPPEPEEPAFPV